MRLLLRNTLRRGTHSTSSPEKIVLALGSNVGNRAETIHDAVDEVKKFARVCKTSFLYESPPPVLPTMHVAPVFVQRMYVTDQPPFLNAACEIETELEPLDLLRAVKRLEREFGRDEQGTRYGPRPIDLDIVTYGERVIHTPDDELIVPHPRLAERDFVLRPLCDISEDYQIPQSDGTKRSAAELLTALLEKERDLFLVKVTPTNTGRLLKWGYKTLLMGVINATPDSFSDGGENNTVSGALRQVEKYVKYGFDVIDIGGQSTRPGAKTVGADEELKRVLPIAGAIRSEFPSLMISADTFHGSVASEMVMHGAEIINDVSAGRHDTEMHEVVRQTRAATVQMHMRGTARTMQNLTQYRSRVAQSVAEELNKHIEKLLSTGVPRWSVIADAGIGFAKTAEQSAALVHDGRAFQAAVGGFPTVLGVSRKSWLGVSGKGEERDWATAGAVGGAVLAGGVDMVRVHRAEVAEAVRAADLVRRGGG